MKYFPVVTESAELTFDKDSCKIRTSVLEMVATLSDASPFDRLEFDLKGDQAPLKNTKLYINIIEDGENRAGLNMEARFDMPAFVMTMFRSKLVEVLDAVVKMLSDAPFRTIIERNGIK
jgi:hypothetical protein